jgi:hypothetical protein
VAAPRLVVVKGTIFGRLTVQGEGPPASDKRRRLNCLCSCGNSVAVRLVNLRSGRATSCGCYQREGVARRSTTHGRKGTPEFSAWVEMRRRCRDVNRNTADSYIIRGITVCAEWEHSFERFFADVGPRPSPEHSIDRIDNDGNYEPNNVQWALPKQQARNRRSNRIIKVNGVAKTVAGWSEDSGISEATIRYRLNRGWDAKDAVSIPTGVRTRWSR